MSKLLSMYEKDDRKEFDYPGGEETVLSCDVVVVGGGGSGLSAAVRAAQKGAKVIIVEKMDCLGGNSNFAGGLLATGSRFHKEAGLPDKTEDYIKANLEKHGYTQNTDLVRRYIENSGTFYEWIADLGFDTTNTRFIFDTVVLMKERTEPGPLNHPAYGPGITGSNIVDVLKSQLEPLGISCLTSTKAMELLTSGDRVCGLLAQGNDKTYHINAKSVILSSGGFGCNQELLDRFLPEYFGSDNYFTHYCLLSTTGDGILMAEKLGAEIGKDVSVGMEAMCHIPGAYSIQLAVRCPEGVIINGYGKRFIAEDQMGKGLIAMDRQPDGIAYYLFRESRLHELYESSRNRANYGDRIPEWDEFSSDLQAEIADGKVLRGETVADLASQIGCNAATLKETLETYDRFCENSHDDQYYKATEHLKPLGDGAYYAAKLYRKFDVTMGGVTIDKKLRVVRPDETPIHGLYAAGDVASGWMGKDYGPLFSSFSWAMNSGYLAGEEAAANAKE